MRTIYRSHYPSSALTGILSIPGQPLSSHYSPHNSLSVFAQTLFIQRQMEQSPKPGTEFHQSSVYLPDMRFTVQSPTHQSYQLICGQGRHPHVVDTTRHLLGQQPFHHIAKIVYRSKRPLFSKAPKGQGHLSSPHYKEDSDCLVAGTMNHAGTQDINLLVIIRINFHPPFSTFNLSRI